MTSSWGRRLLAAAALAVATAGPALAHPHIFIDAKVEIGFDAQGRVAQLHHSWTFDTAFSVWMVQGLDANGDGLVSPEEMQDLANENMEGLATYGFYTSAGDGMHFVRRVTSGCATRTSVSRSTSPPSQRRRSSPEPLRAGGVRPRILRGDLVRWPARRDAVERAGELHDDA